VLLRRDRPGPPCQIEERHRGGGPGVVVIVWLEGVVGECRVREGVWERVVGGG